MRAIPYLFLISFCLLVACQQEAPMVVPDAGVPLSLAEARSAQLSAIRYDLRFEIPAEKDVAIDAKLKVSFGLKEVAGPVVLDFKEKEASLLAVKQQGQVVDYQFANEHVVIPEKALKVGENQFDIDFVAGDLSLNRNDEFLYTLLVPDRARTLFPVFDQPNLKATYQLTLTVPAAWEAVGNGATEETTTAGDRKTIRFAEIEALPTYLFAFAAGKFQKITDEVSQMTMYYRESDTAKVARNAPEIFELHSQSLAWLEDYTGIDYPYNKFDFVLIPPFQYGGMEHPGNIFYRQSTLMLDEGASINQQLRRASLIAHETAHMWFGNLVTMDWFNDVWLKEVFANQMASKIMAPSFPDVNHELNFMLSYYPRSKAVDRTEGTHPIQQSLSNLANAGTVYGNIIYNKAPIVMRNLETLMGEEPFREALKEYLKTYARRNATWDELIKIMEDYTEEDLSRWNKDWVQKKGTPVYDFAYGSNPNGQSYVALSLQNQTGTQLWPQQVAYAGGANKEEEQSIFLSADSVAMTYEPAGSPVLINSDGRGYAYFKISAEDWEQLEYVAGRHENEVTRAAFWLNTWEGVLHGDLDPLYVYRAMAKVAQTEQNPLILANLLGTMRQIFWQFLEEPAQRSVARQTEQNLYKRVIAEQDQSLKRILYNSMVQMTYTEDGGYTLLRTWRDKGSFIKLKLSESDLTTLAYHLALREVSGASNILEELLTAVKSEDRKKRINFVSPALSADESVRDQFFQSLADPANRASEPWVVEALGYLHHPLRQATSKKHVRKSLEMIEEIQETGDIFFPARWLGGVLSTYSNTEVATEVRTFLDQNPALSPKLRDKVLQAGDMVFRSSEVKGFKRR